MTATFAPTTDRPRLFDDRPLRARRPAAPDRDRPQPAPDREHAQPAPDPFAPPAGPESAPDPFAPTADPRHSSEQPDHREPQTPRGDQPTGADAPRHGDTLDHLISTVWDDLAAHRTVTCPVCHGHMAPRYGSGALPVGGRCRRCGSSLG